MRSDPAPMRAILEALADSHTDSHTLRTTRQPLPFHSTSVIPCEVTHEDTLAAPADLSETLRTRRSVLHYSSRAVSAKGILALMSEALKQDRRTWTLDASAGPLEAFIFAIRSSDLTPGVYRVSSSRSVFLAPLSEVGPIENLGVQREFSTASGMVVMYGALERAEDWAGAHGYRISALRASMATYDFHLRCVARGLIGTIFGGFIPSSVRHLVQSDGVTRNPLIAATYGLPRTVDAEGKPESPRETVSAETDLTGLHGQH